MKLALQPAVLRWARDRASLAPADLAARLKVLPSDVNAWEEDGAISFARVEKLAHTTHTPIGYLFLQSAPIEELPIPDFRTVRDDGVTRPSPDLLETIYQMQRRQAWMREFLIEEGEPPLSFIGTISMEADVVATADQIRETLGLAIDWAEGLPTWADALLQLRKRAEIVEILAAINGVVGSDTRRKLDPQEFRGFALCDAHAPLIFINGADAKAGQIFTFVHELVHLWLGQDGVSNPEAMLVSERSGEKVEQFCNAVAAEFLVPLVRLKKFWPVVQTTSEPYQSLAQKFKVSPIVAARRALDAGLESKAAFLRFWRAYEADPRRTQGNEGKAGGDFWRLQNVRVSPRFGAAVVRAAKEGRLAYREAYALTGLTAASFDTYADKLGIRLQ